MAIKARKILKTFKLVKHFHYSNRILKSLTKNNMPLQTHIQAYQQEHGSSLRRYIANSEQVLFATLSEDWRGGTIAGWIFHMMVDDAIARSLAILDRLARIASLVADISFDNRVCF